VKMIEVQHDHAFCNERFVGPLKLELETVGFDEPKRPKRRVRFDRNKKTINPEAEYYTDEDVRIKWWGFDELGDIKQRAKETSIVLRKSLVGRESSLTMAHRKTSLILASDFKALIRLSPLKTCKFGALLKMGAEDLNVLPRKTTVVFDDKTYSTPEKALLESSRDKRRPCNMTQR
jgi:adenine specific DNA methylase Mod